MSDDGNVIELQDGRVELVGTPGHVNVIATDDLSKAEVELRFTPSAMENLAWAVGQDQPVTEETSDGIASWEPGRGLYEAYGDEDFYLICSPDDQERLAEGLRNARPA